MLRSADFVRRKARSSHGSMPTIPPAGAVAPPSNSSPFTLRSMSSTVKGGGLTKAAA